MRFLAVSLVIAAASAAPFRTAQNAPAGTAVINQYCVTCHNQRAKTAGLTLDTMDFEHVDKDAATWEKVVRKIKTGMMPPSGARRPDRAVLDSLAGEIEGRLDRAAAAHPNPGTPALHRLNRTEYANAIHDLLALDVDVVALLPPDDATEGFDNIADALGTSPSLVQGYISAAMKISRRAVGDRTAIPTQTTYNAAGGLSQDRHIEGLPLGTRGGILTQHTFPMDAEYDFSVGGGFGGGAAGSLIDITMDGEKIPVANPRNFRLSIKAGPHVIGAALIDRQKAAGVEEAYSDFRVESVFRAAGGVNSIVITGPFNAAGAGDTPSRHRIFVCYPAGSNEEATCARQIMSTLARRAFHRPVADREIDTLLGFYQHGRKESDFENGVQEAIARLLVAPSFIYREEDEPAGVVEGAVYRVSDLELASRLSFFLWSSIPDDELLDVAIKHRLSDPKVREQQVRRMLADPKSAALITNFAGQWLNLRELAKVETSAKEFDDNLRQSFRRETELLFESIVREDRSVLTLLDANYTFVDERLARHYGIPNIHGSYFRRVTLDDANPRRGILGQGAFLTVTSVGTRTSPVTRGRWILENVLGTPAPVPPPGVDTDLNKDAEAVKVTSLRQRLELHRKVEPCASCHKIMDPIGFALENFDMIGTWRELDGKTPIDASGQLVDGTALKGVADLRKALLSRRDAFATSATQKLLMYGLGRTVQYYDMPAVRSIVRNAAQHDYRFSSLVLGVVESAPFQTKMKKGVGGPAK
jgi:cytochrome c551/c552